MTRYEQIAKRAVAAELSGRKDPISLFNVSAIADTAARGAGKKRDLYTTLHDYPDLLPPGWRTRWLTAEGGSGDGMLMAVPEGWQPGSSNSQSLVLGRGKLVDYREAVD